MKSVRGMVMVIAFTVRRECVDTDTETQAEVGRELREVRRQLRYLPADP